MATQQIVSSVVQQQKSPQSEAVIERLQAHRFDGLKSQMAVVPLPSQITTPASLPKSFQEALRLGWKVAKEESAIGIDRKTRAGVVLLRLKDAAVQLRVPYTATAKAFAFGTPESIPVA